MIDLTAKELAEAGAKAEKRFFQIKWSDPDNRDELLYEAIERSAVRAAIIDRLVLALDEVINDRGSGYADERAQALMDEAEQYGLLRFE